MKSKRTDEHGPDGRTDKQHPSAEVPRDRRAGFRVADNQRSGHGSSTAWSRMSMLERRKRMWLEVRREKDD